MTDIQRGLAWALILCFTVIIVLFTVFAAVGRLPDPLLDVYKQFGTALINIVMVVVGFFFGSSQGSKDKDDARNAVMKTLAANVGTSTGGGTAAVTEAAERAAPAAAAEAAPPAAEVAAPPAAEVAVAEALAKREETEHEPENRNPG